MGVVLLQILQWILRVILFLLLLIVVLVAIILIVPIRYQVEGEFLEKKPGARGKITWFLYLIYMKFCYEEEFHIQVRVFGFKVYDSAKESSGKIKSKKKPGKETENVVEETSVDELAAWEKEIEAEAKEEAELASHMEAEFSKHRLQEKASDSSQKEQKVSSDIEQSSGQEEQKVPSNIEQSSGQEEQKVPLNIEQSSGQEEQENASEQEKKSITDKIESIKNKVQDIIQKIKDIISKIQDGKLKVEHYIELWNREETQTTFNRAKKKFGRMIKAILPRKWKLTGEIGFSNPATTGQLMGALGAMYPILGNKVQVVPNFENEVMNIEGSVKGHIRLGNLLYQVVSLLLNRHCFKFIKLIFDELNSSKKSKKEI